MSEFALGSRPRRTRPAGTADVAKYESAMASLAHATKERNHATAEAQRLRKELDEMNMQASLFHFSRYYFCSQFDRSFLVIACIWRWKLFVRMHGS